MTFTARPDSFELSDYLGVLRRRWRIIVAFTILGTLAAAAYIVVAPKAYTATSSVYVTTNAANVSELLGDKTTTEVNMDNEAAIVTSNSVATLVLTALHSTLTPYQVIQQVSVTVPANTQILRISCSRPSARGSAACAEAFAAAYLTSRSATAQTKVQSQIRADEARETTLEAQSVKLQAQLLTLRTGTSRAAAAHELLANISTQLGPLRAAVAALGASNNYKAGYVITAAAPPGAPSSPRKLLYGPSGLMAGLLIGLILAFAADRRDGRVHSAPDVERFLDLPVLFTLAQRQLGLQSTLVPPRSTTGRAFTELAGAVASTLGDGNHVLLVAGTSAGPDTSVVAANLSATLARVRSDVVLICADQQGSLSSQLAGIGVGPGLAELIAGAATVGDVVRPCAEVPRLRVIAPGVDTGAVDDLQYDVCRRMVVELHRGARYIIIDAGVTTDGGAGLSLAEFADAAIIVVQAGTTQREEIADCVRRLGRIRTEVLGAAVLPAPSRAAARAYRSSAAAPQPRPDSRKHPQPSPQPGPGRPPPAPGRRRPSGTDQPGSNARPLEPSRPGEVRQEPPAATSYQQEFTRRAGPGKPRDDLPSSPRRPAGHTWPLPREVAEKPAARPPADRPVGEMTERN